MPNPKDPEKFAAYREKMRQIALKRGYGKWMTGRKVPSEAVEKRRKKQIEIGNDAGSIELEQNKENLE